MAQNQITGLVAVGVVDLLETVDVEDDQTGGFIVAECVAEVLVELLGEGLLVADAGQAVLGGRLVLVLMEGFLQRILVAEL